MHRLLPVLHQALADRGMQPERAARRVAGHPLTWEGAPDVAIDGPARRRQRPGEPTKHREHSSGTQTAHTDKNLLLVNETTSTVVSRGPTEPGKTHDKQAADPAQLVSPINAMLDKDTGLQGDEPTGVRTRQPKKSPKARHEVGGSPPASPLLQCPRGRGKRACWSQTVSDGQRCLAPDQKRCIRSGHGNCLWFT